MLYSCFLVLVLCNLILIISLLVSMLADEKVTVLESEKRAWESSSESEAIREALNPWRKRDTEAGKRS